MCRCWLLKPAPLWGGSLLLALGSTVIGVDTFGSSAPGAVVMEHYGFTVENVCKQAHVVLDRLKEKA